MELNRKNIRSLILGAMGCIVLYWLLHETERVRSVLRWGMDLVAPFLVGSCIAFILNVPMRAIETAMNKVSPGRGNRSVAILLTFVVILLVLGFVVYLLVPQVQETIQAIGDQFPGFLTRAEEFVRQFLRDNPQVEQWIVDNTDFENLDWPKLVQQAVDLAGESISAFLDKAVSAVGNVISGLWSAFVSLVFCLYCLSNKERLARQGRRILYSFVPEAWSDEVVRVLRLTNSTFSNFLSGQCIEVCILGVMFAVTMTLFRMPYVPLVSVLVAVTAFIPIVGAWIGCVLGAFFILVNDPMQALWFVVMFVVLQQIENNLVYPRVVGTSVGLPSMWVLFSVSVGGKIMGVAGMVLMIPMVSVIYALLRDFTGKRVAQRGIPPEKLVEQPPELKSKLKEKREINRKKREAKRAEQLAQMMRESFHIPQRHSDSNQSRDSSDDT